MKVSSKQAIVIVLLTFSILIISCNKSSKPNSGKEAAKPEEVAFKVTFIELGSVWCIPCQQMQPVMKSIREKYETQVNVVFYDVWTEAGAPYGQKYGIEVIPTQVFLDVNGKEYFRHVGFFPEEDVVAVLKMKGIK